MTAALQDGDNSRFATEIFVVPEGPVDSTLRAVLGTSPGRAKPKEDINWSVGSRQVGLVFFFGGGGGIFI